MNEITAAVREWTWEHGQFVQGSQWINSPYDTWELNPHYHGPDQPHPESLGWDDEDELHVIFEGTSVDRNSENYIPCRRDGDECDCIASCERYTSTRYTPEELEDRREDLATDVDIPF